MNKNYGLLIAKPRPTDYLFGVNSQIEAARFVSDWSKYLPDNESQRNNIVDFLDCTTMSGIHAIEMQLTYLLQTHQMSDEAINFFTDNGHIVNGKIKLSTRYNAKMNGTDIQNGQYLNVAGDHFRSDGLLPYSRLPMTLSMTWKEYYAPVPQEDIDLAKKALWFVNIQYQWTKKEEIPNNLKTSPVQVGTEVCAGWDSGHLVQMCSGLPLQHATIIYGQDNAGNWLDFDHYPPYKQVLASDYELPLNLHYVVSMKPVALRIGMRGANVLNLQKNLNAIGKYGLKADGVYGSATCQAVIDFQAKNGLARDGIAGPLTLAKIQARHATPSITDIITQVCQENGVEPILGVSVASCESSLDPNCLNKNTDSRHTTDRGLFQFNDYWHNEIPDSVAFDPKLATEAFCKLVKQGALPDWRYSKPCWGRKVPADILKKYGA